MKLNFTFKHLDRSESLEKYTAQGLDEISRFLLKDGTGSIYVSKQSHKFCVEMSVNTREKYFRAMATHEDVYQAVDAAVEKLEKQFLKMRQLMRNHKHPELAKPKRFERFRKAA